MPQRLAGLTGLCRQVESRLSHLQRGQLHRWFRKSIAASWQLDSLHRSSFLRLRWIIERQTESRIVRQPDLRGLFAVLPRVRGLAYDLQTWIAGRQWRAEIRP